MNIFESLKNKEDYFEDIRRLVSKSLSSKYCRLIVVVCIKKFSYFNVLNIYACMDDSTTCADHLPYYMYLNDPTVTLSDPRRFPGQWISDEVFKEHFRMIADCGRK
jgi:hypothetical protein